MIWLSNQAMGMPMKRILSLSSALFLAVAAVAQPPDNDWSMRDDSIEWSQGFRQVMVVDKLPVTIKVIKRDAVFHQWDVPAGVVGSNKGDTFEVIAAPRGETKMTVRFVVPLVDWEKKSFKLQTVTRDVGFIYAGIEPVPIPPTPEPPGPKPPEPTPNPISGTGRRAMLIYETGTVNSLSKAHQQILFGRPFRQFLEERVTKDTLANGKQEPARRVWDTNTNPATDQKWAQEMMARPREKLPWIILSNSLGTFHEGELPPDETQARALVSKILP